MLMLTDREMRMAALKLANNVREQLGYPPVKKLYPGKPKDPLDCPITNTIYDDDIPRSEYRVHTGGIWVAVRKVKPDGTLGNTTTSLEHTRGSRQFLTAFDWSKKFPRLRKKEK